MENCIFCKIKNKEIPKDFLYEDEEFMVFPDLHPVKPVHLLIIPKKHIPEFTQVDDRLLFGKIGAVIQRMIRQFQLEEKGYRITVNGGGAQDINHLHFHLLGPIAKAA